MLTNRLHTGGCRKAIGFELKAERREPSGEKHCKFADPSTFTGVLAHFRLHYVLAIGRKANGEQTSAKTSHLPKINY